MKLVLYLFKKIIPVFFGAVFFFSVVLNMVDLFMNISTYLQQQAPAGAVLRVMVLYIPKTLWYAVPVGILFATSFTLSVLYANNELEALFASGVSLFRFTFPLLLLSVVMSVGLFFFENRFVIGSYEQKTRLQNSLLKRTAAEDNDSVTIQSDNARIVYRAGRYTESAHRLDDVMIVFRDSGMLLDSVIVASSASWDEDRGRWNVNGGKQYVRTAGGMERISVLPEYEDRLTESYEIFRKSTADVQTMNAADAKVYIGHLRKAGLPYQEQLSEYYKKFSFSAIIFIVVFLSIGLTGKTKKNVLLISLASSISAAVLFYVCQMVTMILAKFGVLSPFLGAWFPVIFFTAVSIVLLRFSRT